MESVLFNSDSLFKIASYLPADGLLNLALTCRQFGIVPTRSSGEGESDSLSLVEETARRKFKILQQRKKRMHCQVMTETIGYQNIIISNH